MSREVQIFVPRLMDAANTNAQNLNARAMLSRFGMGGAQWRTLHYDSPDAVFAGAPRVHLKKLWRTRLWQTHVLLSYQQSADGIFYPGMEWFDARGLELRRAIGRRIPVVGTLEGLVGDEERERHLESIVGHKVYCHRAPKDAIVRIDQVLRSCDHLIAITPMLAKVAQEVYCKSVSMLPLGTDGSVFKIKAHTASVRPRVLTVATLTERKRPEAMVDIAGRLRDIDFVWYGSGPLLDPMKALATEKGVTNLTFPGGLAPRELAEEYARADLFVLPSLSEGAPKALQEASACGVPRIAFGYYEPMIANGKDGFVVWSDEELRQRIEEVCKRREDFRRAAVETAPQCDWDEVAPLWEHEIIAKIGRSA